MYGRFLLFVFLSVSSLAFAFQAGAQSSTPNQITPGTETGTMPYNIYGGVRENINLGTGDLNLQIPLLTLPGRNGHKLSLELVYDSKIWQLHHDFDTTTGLDSFWWDYSTPPYPGDGVVWHLNIPTLMATWRDITGPQALIQTTCWEGLWYR
jgi:hypothetical protein